ncbi:MAG: hypothetical protein MHPSP_001688, partial [Paramarteilia canceri]
MKKKKIDHCGVPECYGYGVGKIEELQYRFMVIPYFDETLFNYFIAKKKKLIFEDMKIMCSNLVNSLQFIHDHDFTHGDIKPENIMFKSDDLKR